MKDNKQAILTEHIYKQKGGTLSSIKTFLKFATGQISLPKYVHKTINISLTFKLKI